MANYPLRLLHDALTATVEIYPDKTALIVEGECYSYDTLHRDAHCFAAALAASGVTRGDHVALYLDNTYTNVLSLYATLYTGAVFIIINPQTKSDKLEYILSDSGAVALITDTHLFPQVTPILPRCSRIRSLFYSGNVTTPPAVKPGCAVCYVPDALAQHSPHTQAATVISADLAALIYTSGSTGNPKGVMMSHAAMLFASQSVSQYLRIDHSHTIINVLPLAFDYGLYQVLMSVLHGATLILERSFTYPAKVLKCITEHQVTVFPGVPTIYTTLIAMHRRKPICFPSVTRITNTAAALPPDYTGELHQIFPNARIFRMYGLTECKRVCYLEPETADDKPESVGKAIPGTETVLLNPDGTRCAPGETGILHVRGPHIMMGYWNAPELSAKMLKPGPYPGERMLCTHDWFKTDADGDLYFLGRSDDIIKSRGEKVSPVEVENVLISLKGIREAAVIGVEDDLLGQAIKAFVALDDPSITAAAVKKHCVDHLENFMVPKYIEILPELPKTASGKITKKGLK